MRPDGVKETSGRPDRSEGWCRQSIECTIDLVTKGVHRGGCRGEHGSSVHGSAPRWLSEVYSGACVPAGPVPAIGMTERQQLACQIGSRGGALVGAPSVAPRHLPRCCGGEEWDDSAPPLAAGPSRGAGEGVRYAGTEGSDSQPRRGTLGAPRRGSKGINVVSLS